MKRNHQEKKASRGLRIAVALAVLGALLLNTLLLLAPDLVVMRDQTDGDLYTVSDEMQRFLDGMSEDVTVYLIEAGASDKKFEYYVERLAQSSERLSLKRADAKDCESLLLQKNLSADSIANLGYCLIVESEKRFELLDYSSMFYYEITNSTLNNMGLTKVSVSEYQAYATYFSQDEQYAQYLSYLLTESYQCFQGEALLAAVLEYVTAEVIPVHYVLTGHGEADFAQTALAEIYTYNGSAYQSLDLRGVGEIPSDAATVLSIAPQTDYSEAEIRAMRSYLERGGQIVFVTDEENLAMPNLMSLMATYGMTAEGGAVKEWVTREEEGEDGETETIEEASDSVTITVNTAHDALAALDQLSGIPSPVITGGNSLTLDQNALPSLLVYPLLITSEHAFVGDESEEKSVHTLAAAAETADGAHLLWFTGADSFLALASEITDSADPRLSNDYCVYMTVTWANLTYESHLPEISDKRYESGYLQATNSDATVFLVFFIVLIPLTVVGVGFGVLHWRKKRA